MLAVTRAELHVAHDIGRSDFLLDAAVKLERHLGVARGVERPELRMHALVPGDHIRIQPRRNATPRRVGLLVLRVIVGGVDELPQAAGGPKVGVDVSVPLGLPLLDLVGKPRLDPGGNRQRKILSEVELPRQHGVVPRPIGLVADLQPDELWPG